MWTTIPGMGMSWAGDNAWLLQRAVSCITTQATGRWADNKKELEC